MILDYGCTVVRGKLFGEAHSNETQKGEVSGEMVLKQGALSRGVVFRDVHFDGQLKSEVFNRDGP